MKSVISFEAALPHAQRHLQGCKVRKSHDFRPFAGKAGDAGIESQGNCVSLTILP
jgi:hypothetical protein